MNKNVKLGLQIGGAVIVALVGYKIYKDIMAKRGVNARLGNPSILTNDRKGNLEGKKTKVDFDAEYYADEIYKRLKGWTSDTEESEVVEIIRSVPAKDRKALESEFDSRGYSLSLRLWLLDEIDDEYEQQEIKSLMGY